MKRRPELRVDVRSSTLPRLLSSSADFTLFSRLAHVVGTLATAATRHTVSLAASTIVDNNFGCSFHQTASALRSVARTPPSAVLAMLATHAAGCAVGKVSTAASCAASSAAPRSTVMKAVAARHILVFAALSLNFSSAQSHGHTANANMVLARGIANHRSLSVVSDLGNLRGYLICSTETGAGSSGAARSTAASTDNL
ncbi:hypothetical protein HG530_008912 [Fusarium avenaceum]|nr:hypothetical protein HG530_008912 [Fusarium avenaceum]